MDAGVRPRSEAAERARAGGLRMAAFAAVALALSTMVPAPLVAATLSALLTAAAAGTALVGALGSEPVFEERLTYWDEMAVLLMAGIVAGAFAAGA